MILSGFVRPSYWFQITIPFTEKKFSFVINEYEKNVIAVKCLICGEWANDTDLNDLYEIIYSQPYIYTSMISYVVDLYPSNLQHSYLFNLIRYQQARPGCKPTQLLKFHIHFQQIKQLTVWQV